ncbi:MAG: hypothetical protein ACFE68_09520 [Candidatus Hodarchaeota archaeon]
MMEKVVEKIFQAQFALVDLREILRKTKPLFNLSEEQKQQVRDIVKVVRDGMDLVEKELIK